MPITAAIVADTLLFAAAAPLNVPAQSGGSASSQRAERSHLEGIGLAPLNKTGSKTMDHIG
jgi:hypothetical protein